MRLLNRAVLAGTLLAVAGLPLDAQVTNVAITGQDVKNACPNQVMTAKGVIQVNRPTTVVYYWQWALYPSAATGNQKLTNHPPISHLFTAPGSFNVTSLPLGIPKGFSGTYRLVVGGYVSGSINGRRTRP